MRTGAVIAWLAWPIFACGGRTLAVDSNAEVAAEAGMTKVAQADGGAPIGTTEASADSPGNEAGSPPASAEQPMVWIGETYSTVTLPPGDFDGGDTIPFMPDDTPPEKVVLIMAASAGSVVGTVTFGDDRPPASPTDPKQSYPLTPTMRQYQDAQPFPLSPIFWASWPYPGFSYSLVSSSVDGNVFNLAFVPSELWRDWCALQDPTVGPPSLSDKSDPCDCSSGTCRAQSSPIHRLDLTVDGGAMQGQLSLYEGTVSMQLQRVQ